MRDIDIEAELRHFVMQSFRLSDALNHYFDEIGRAVDSNAANKLIKAQSSFEPICYRAAEYFEWFQSRLKSVLARLGLGNSVKGGMAKLYRASSAHLCNAVKHEAQPMSLGLFICQDHEVPAFTLLRSSGANLVPDRNFHKGGEEYRSINLELQRLLGGIFELDRDLRKIVRERFAHEITLRRYFSLPGAKSFEKIAALPRRHLPGERQGSYEFSLTRDTLEIRRVSTIMYRNAAQVFALMPRYDGITQRVGFGANLVLEMAGKSNS